MKHRRFDHKVPEYYLKNMYDRIKEQEEQIAELSDAATEEPECKRFGIIVAIELDAILKLYPDIEELDGPVGYKTYKIRKPGCVIYVCRCGMGTVAASAGVQYLISRFGVSAIVNFGVVGGLTGDMKQQKVVLVDRVVHYKYDCHEFMDLVPGQVDGHSSIFLPTDAALKAIVRAEAPDLPLVTCCSGDKFVGTAEEKTLLHTQFEGDICDMESAGIVLSCEANGVPCILFKAVSDGLSDGAAGFYAELQSASLLCLQMADKMMGKL